MQEVYEVILQRQQPRPTLSFMVNQELKELVAKANPRNKRQKQKGFITVHCGAIPETLMESGIFSVTKKGSFNWR